MILPQSSFGTLIVLILSLCCLGLWANTYKLAGKLRFELYYIDFATGLGLAALIYAFTFGNLGYDGFSFMDDLMQSHKRQWLDAVGAGVVFNLANLLMVGAISVSGMAVAVPVSLGFGLVVGRLLGQLGQRAANPLYLAVGCGVIMAAIVATAIAQSSLVAARKAAPKTGKAKRTPGPLKPLILAVSGGLLLGFVQLMLTGARTGDVSLGPYTTLFLFGAGAFLSTTVFSLFFMNLPLNGEPLEVMDFFHRPARSHLLGLIGGILFCTGLAGTFVATSTAPEGRVGSAATFALSNGGLILAAVCGLLFWKEFQEGGGRGKGLAFLALVLFAAGLAVLSMAFA